MKKRFIWIFGENLGETADNNSFYFWKQVALKDDGIDKYFVMDKNSATKAVYQKLEHRFKKFIIWKNSIQHFRLYFAADMFFVSLSYRDVRPEHYLWRDFNFVNETPIIYLQHGTIAMKRLGYEGNSYNNNLFRFIYYNPRIGQALKEVNGLKEYQLYYGKHLPRDMELIRKNDIWQKEKTSQTKKTILWFLTWREYQNDEDAFLKLFLTVKYVISNPKLLQYLEKNHYEIEVCFHRNFNVKWIDKIFYGISAQSIRWTFADSIDVMDELVKSEVLITDYSSVGFDFTLLNKPVILFMPDLDEYSMHREFYCEIEELKQDAVLSPDELICRIVEKNYGIHPFFRKRMPEVIDYDSIRQGKHIEKMYRDFADIQHHKVTFIGYNFYGVGGTVLATRALAEALLEKGYLVQLLSLVQRSKAADVPCALNMKALYSTNRNTIRNLLKRGLFRGKKHFYYYLKYDKDWTVLSPYAGYGMKQLMKRIKSETVISTRESLHLFLYDATSPYIKNKIYFYHCAASVFEEVFPNAIERLKEIQVEKAVFVSDNNRIDMRETYQYEGYDEYMVLGNALDSSRMIERSEICPVQEKAVYSGIYLLRISRERKDDIENLLAYGRYLKQKKCSEVVIDVYGKGNMLEEFYAAILSEGLSEYIRYCGFVSNPKEVLEEHDAVVDFSLHNSFGMPYIEGVLNGKMVFCMKNTGSLEVLADIPDAFIESFDDLTDKMRKLPLRTKEELTKNYDKIYEKYSRNVVGTKLLAYINKETNDGI
jgi:hypothetical protein